MKTEVCVYSWEEKQLKTFIEDLLEHKSLKNSNAYCYGNILLETIKKDREYEIIDGQQRLTTLSIFLRSLFNVMSERIKNGKTFKIDDEIINIETEINFYIIDNGSAKLRPTPNDCGCYDTLIIENKNDYQSETPSQKRMKFAKEFFYNELNKLDEEDLTSIFCIVQNSTINRIELEGKKESALMFELQNNRGKELTNLEKLKSFLMYQVYAHSKADETEYNINYISKQRKL